MVNLVILVYYRGVDCFYFFVLFFAVGGSNGIFFVCIFVLCFVIGSVCVFRGGFIFVSFNIGFSYVLRWVMLLYGRR